MNNNCVLYVDETAACLYEATLKKYRVCTDPGKSFNFKLNFPGVESPQNILVVECNIM